MCWLWLLESSCQFLESFGAGGGFRYPHRLCSLRNAAEKVVVMGGGVVEYKSLAKAVELDTEWFRSVTSQLPNHASSSIVPFASPYSDNGGSNGNISIADSTYPCPLCGMVTPSRSRHILNHCERLKDRYTWRKENVIHYLDSLLDHNTFKVFCNLQDRRTTSGGTIPTEIQPLTGQLINWKSLVPEIVAIDRLTDEVFIFVISLPHETEIEAEHAEQLNKYHQAILAMRRSFKSTVNFFALEIGSGSGFVSESSRVALYEIHKLTLTRQPPLESFIRNVSQLAKLGSYRIFKSRHEARTGTLHKLYPDSGGRVFSATKRNILNKYVYPLARAGGCIVAIIFLLFLLYLTCLLLQWIWSMLSSSILVIVFLAIVAGCLNLFRP